MLGSVTRPTPAASGSSLPTSRRYYAWELGIVMALSLGRSAVYSALALAEKMSLAPLSEQSATVHSSRSRHELFDLSYQVLDSLFALAPVALILYLVFLHGRNPFRLFGLDLRRPGRDLVTGVGLFAVIGAGTLVVYFLGRNAGITMEMIPSDLTEHWWTTPTLLLAAVRHALVEEIIMIAYLFDRARRLWPGSGTDARDSEPGGRSLSSMWPIIVAAAVLRGVYHLYQGFGPGIGNLLMGLVFGALYVRYGRIMPLVIAHFLLDAVAFLAFPLVLELSGAAALLSG